MRALNAFLVDATASGASSGRAWSTPRSSTAPRATSPSCEALAADRAARAGRLRRRARPGGPLFVLEDNLRAPSGFAYAVAARARSTPARPTAWSSATSAVAAQPCARLARAATGRRRASSVLSDGAEASSWWEHEQVARCVGGRSSRSPISSTRRARVVRAARTRTPPGRRRVPPLRRGPPARRARRAPDAAAGRCSSRGCKGTVAVVNAFGTGLGDDKLVHAHVEAMVRFYLGEEPLVRPSRPPTSPRGGPGRAGRPAALRREAARAPAARASSSASSRGGPRCLAADLAADPGPEHRQRTILLEPPDRRRRAPTAAPRRPAPLCLSTASTPPGCAAPGGLTRVALDDGALVVNSHQNGGAKATWVQRWTPPWAPCGVPYTVGIEEEVMLLDPGDWSSPSAIDGTALPRRDLAGRPGQQGDPRRGDGADHRLRRHGRRRDRELGAAPAPGGR